MNKNSNIYVTLYAIGLTVICGALLASAFEVLKPNIAANQAYDLRRNVLLASIKLEKGDNVDAIFEKRVKTLVINAKGEIVKGQDAEKVNLAEEYRKKREERIYPVYILGKEGSPDVVEAYIMPLYGFGLWDNIFGYVGIDADGETIKGVVFGHKGETAGLGARITDNDIQRRFIGKKIFEGDKLTPVTMVKGERGGGDVSIKAFADQPHQVDGMSGATLTAEGLSNMLDDYLRGYEAYIRAERAKKSKNL
jgi:Na+-transporting NADH:ubiquinone oxidoreductase subunit C